MTIQINGQQSPAYIGWSPVPCTISFPGGGAPASITLSCIQAAGGGAVVFTTARNVAGTSTLTLPVPPTGIVDCFIAGSVASTADQDVRIDVSAAGASIGTATVMVRIRKNANTLSAPERDRFLYAFAKFNATTGNPNYTAFLNMHNDDAYDEIHTGQDKRFSFLPWHRAFILDLERQLQAIDASVALPYWKFDEKAPNVFSADFMGAYTQTGTLAFSSSNYLGSWKVNGASGLIRMPKFNDQTSPARAHTGPLVKTDAQTLAIGSTGALFFDVRGMEQSPHNYAHSCFESNSPLAHPEFATQDPLFFLLHCNVDRLWALWQKHYLRYDISTAITYPYPGGFNPATSTQRIGDYIDDTMWPWNGVKGQGINGPPGDTRPVTAPRGGAGTFPQTSYPSSPSATPMLWETIDYQAQVNGVPSSFDYDFITF